MNSPRSILAPAAPAAEILAKLGWPSLVGCTAVSVVMAILLVVVAVRHRGSFAEHAPVHAGGGLRWVVIGGFIIPGIAFTAAYVATIGSLRAFPMSDGAPGPADIRIIGHQWWWEVDYLMGDTAQHFKTANEIHVPTDRPVNIELVSADVIHSFWVPRLHGKVDLIPGLDNHIEIRAPQPGTYEGSCAEFCGLQHARMRFLVMADKPADFAAWIARQRQPAPPPATLQAARGETVFMGGPCPVCHAIQGTRALASAGPDLTHLGSRQTIGAGWLPKDVATLHAWIMNAPSLKPGVQMPQLTWFNGPELHDLVAYLEGLK
ncbi:MAG: cytochrome c oxidase subunit II [Polyangia bacterium]